jgi:hypothetical protein
MKYTAKITQSQFVGSVMIEPEGGDLTEKQVAEIKKNLWGKELIRKGILHIEGVKSSDIVDEPKKGAAKKEAQKTDTGVNVDLKGAAKK